MLETVPRQGKATEPTKPLSLRVPEALLDTLSAIARGEDRSLNAQVVRALREWLAQRTEHPKP